MVGPNFRPKISKKEKKEKTRKKEKKKKKKKKKKNRGIKKTDKRVTIKTVWLYELNYFSYMYIAAASAPIHALLELFQPVLRTIFFPSHWLLSHITIVETTDSGERGMNPVAMTIINPQKKYWSSRDRNGDPLYPSTQHYRQSYGVG